MITVANRIYVAPEYREAFEERFRNRAQLVDGMPGFISNQVLRPVNDDDPYVVFTLWESRKDFESWVESEEFRKVGRSGYTRVRWLIPLSSDPISRTGGLRSV